VIPASIANLTVKHARQSLSFIRK